MPVPFTSTCEQFQPRTLRAKLPKSSPSIRCCWSPIRDSNDTLAPPQTAVHAADGGADAEQKWLTEQDGG